MTLDFVDWIQNKKRSQIGSQVENNNNSLSIIIDIGGKVEKVRIFQSDPNLIKQVIIVDNEAIFPINQLVDIVDSWQKNEQLRKDVCQKLVTYLESELSKPKQWILTNGHKIRELNKVKATLRVAALKNLLFTNDNQSPVEPLMVVGNHFLPGAKYSLVVNNTYPSLLALCTRIVPYLLSGIALTIHSDAQCSIYAAYLIDLLHQFGLPSSGVIINQLINFELTNEGQIATFLLLDSADVVSAVDNAFASQIVHGVPCVKIFAQDSLRSTIHQTIGHKLRVESPENDLYFEDELFLFDQSNNNNNNNQAKVNLDAVNIETNKSGLDVYYFRTIGEVIKMVNHLHGPLRQRLVSIWSEKTGLGLKVAQGVNSCKQVLVNSPTTTVWCDCLFGWHFELIATSPLSQLAVDNAELPINSSSQFNKR